jgi:hypothetical protein
MYRSGLPFGGGIGRSWMRLLITSAFHYVSARGHSCNEDLTERIARQPVRHLRGVSVTMAKEKHADARLHSRRS